MSPSRSTGDTSAGTSSSATDAIVFTCLSWGEELTVQPRADPSLLLQAVSGMKPWVPDRLQRVTQTSDLTGLLRAWSDGDAEALEQLAPVVHRELRGIARRLLSGERLGIGWQPTDLVQESYVRLLDWHGVHTAKVPDIPSAA
jgi:hypothetical protein